MGQSTRRRGPYVVFDKSIAEDAKKRFGVNVECRTAHSLEFQSVGRTYRERINRSARVPAWQTAQQLGIGRDLPVNSTRISVKHQARLVMGMVRRFCYTTDRQLTARHLDWANGLDTGGQDFVARELLPYAVKAWEDLEDPSGELPFEHDHYMMMWALTSPVLGADFVLLDEAQDANPVIAQAATELQAGRSTSHPELFLFSSWGEVQEYVEQDSAGSDLKAIVQLVDTHGPETILAAAQRLTPEEHARVTVSTAHKANPSDFDRLDGAPFEGGRRSMPGAGGMVVRAYGRRVDRDRGGSPRPRPGVVGLSRRSRPPRLGGGAAWASLFVVGGPGWRSGAFASGAAVMGGFAWVVWGRQDTERVAIMPMSSCSRLWQWARNLPR
ncbi:hypothetical protein [Kitasatospora nipponensis]